MHFEYNILNLADNITYSGVMRASYTYLSDGTKLSVTDANGTGYDYLGSLTYSKSGNIRTLESTDFSSGRIVKSGNSTTPYYYIADHLGSTRVILDNSQNVLWRSDYYPYGTLHNSGNSYPITIPNRYTFSGKEEQTTGTLDLLDFGARDYDRTLCRWMTQDPLSSKYPGISQYVYCVNNPVKFIDPEGREVRVAKEYQEQFRNDLQNVFGDRTNMLSFNDNGTLQLDGKAKDFTKGMTKDQKEAFKGLNKAMSDKQVTSVVYADNYDITVGNKIKSVDIVQEYGGGLYSKTDNLIVIAPSVRSVDVTLDQIQIITNGLGENVI